jgi:hypothetical protein
MEPQYHKIRSKSFKPFSRQEWESILRRNDLDNVKQTRLKDSLLQGIPSELRGEIWVFLTKANQLLSNFSENVYKKLLSNTNPEVSQQIQKDLHRTYPEHRVFQEREGIGQQALNNVLNAYANYDPEVGYCQGMGFIVACLILQIRNEVLSFWAFVQIMHLHNWRLLFK